MRVCGLRLERGRGHRVVVHLAVPGRLLPVVWGRRRCQLGDPASVLVKGERQEVGVNPEM